MPVDKIIPKRLYKYRDFGSLTLDMLVRDFVYYADPSTFNDPMDAKPSIELDLEEENLKKIVKDLVEKRTSAKMRSAAKVIGYRGPRTKDHIRRHSRRQANQVIEEIEYNATEWDNDTEEQKRSLLLHYIREELLQQYDKGIMSLAERATCPLMWSHYGDQHCGICLGYSVPDRTAAYLYKVDYRGRRLVKASMVAAMLDGDDGARRQVDEAVLLRKAGSWSYEREWRLIGPRGLQHSLLELEEVIFGMRCKTSTKFAVMKALKGRDRAVNFFEMHETPDKFKLRKRSLSYDNEMFARFPSRSLTLLEGLKPVDADVSSLN